MAVYVGLEVMINTDKYVLCASNRLLAIEKSVAVMKVKLGFSERVTSLVVAIFSGLGALFTASSLWKAVTGEAWTQFLQGYRFEENLVDSFSKDNGLEKSKIEPLKRKKLIKKTVSQCSIRAPLGQNITPKIKPSLKQSILPNNSINAADSTVVTTNACAAPSKANPAADSLANGLDFPLVTDNQDKPLSIETQFKSALVFLAIMNCTDRKLWATVAATKIQSPVVDLRNRYHRIFGSSTVVLLDNWALKRIRQLEMQRVSQKNYHSSSSTQSFLKNDFLSACAFSATQIDYSSSSELTAECTGSLTVSQNAKELLGNKSLIVMTLFISTLGSLKPISGVKLIPVFAAVITGMSFVRENKVHKVSMPVISDIENTKIMIAGQSNRVEELMEEPSLSLAFPMQESIQVNPDSVGFLSSEVSEDAVQEKEDESSDQANNADHLEVNTQILVSTSSTQPVNQSNLIDIFLNMFSSSGAQPLTTKKTTGRGFRPALI